MSRMWKNLITPETITKELCVLSIEGAARGKTRDGSRPKIRKVMRNLDKYAGRLQRIMLDPVNKLHLHKYTHRTIHENRKARELVYSELDMYGYSREFVKIPHLLWVDQVTIENRAKNNR